MRDWLDGPLLFLDIDGVLNSQEFANRDRQPGLMGIDPIATKRLERIVRETGCSIVLSSTWRRLYSLVEMKEKLHAAGMAHPIPLIDRTPYLDGKARGFEINAWIDSMGFEGPHVIVDDDADFLPGQPLVRTSFAVGLTDNDADRCIDLLNRIPAVHPDQPWPR